MRGYCRVECPECGSNDVKRLGIVENGFLYSCEECGHSWVARFTSSHPSTGGKPR